MASLQNQTSINQGRFFFATRDDGEQELYTSTITAGPIEDFYVGINGTSGNLVQINQMPDIIGTSTAGGEEMLYAGTASTYKTLSTLNVNATGLSMSIDRTPGTGIACIESYASNGNTGGFEFLTRGPASVLNSTVMDSYFTSIGRPGATAVLGASGNLVTGAGTTATELISLKPQAPQGGAGCMSINDLSGGNSRTRWSWFKYGLEGLGPANSGTDLALASYSDAGNFIQSAMTIRRSDNAMAITNLSSINGVPFDLSGVLPWEVYTVTNTATQAVTLSPGVPQTVLTFSNIPVPAQGINAGGMAMSLPIAVQNTSLTGPAFVTLGGYFGGSTSGGSGVYATVGLNSNLTQNTVTLSGVAIHNGSSNVLTVTAVTDVAGTYNFTQGTTAFYKFFFQPVF